MTKLAVIVGLGSGLGLTLAQQLHSAGYTIVGLNRRPVEEITQAPFIEQALSLDTTDADAVDKTMADLIQTWGTPEVLIHNTAQLTIKSLEDTSSNEFEKAWQSMALSAFNLFKATLPSMAKAGKGSVIVSGATASLRGGAKFSAFASAKFALRGLTQAVAREYQSQGVHVSHVLLDGILDTPNSRELHSLDPSKMLKTQDVASAYLNLINQPTSSWTHELDLRPFSESF